MRLPVSQPAAATNLEAFEALCRYIPGGVNSPFRGFQEVGGTPPVIGRGEGAYVWDVEGKRYLDLLGAWGPLLLGHAPPAVVAAAHAAVQDGSVYGASCPAELELARRVCERFNIDMVRFVNSGTEAVMSAVRLARGCTGRALLVRFEGNYHGHSDVVLDGAPNTIVLPYNDADALRKCLAQHPVAAVIVEPVTGSMSLVEPDAAFRAALEERHGALLICDEVVTGLRLPDGANGLKPDLICLGKAISGGFAIGAYGGRCELMEQLSPLGPVYQAGTYSGNPLSMRCGIATFDAMAEPGTYEHLELLGRSLADGWRSVLGPGAQVGQVGSLVGIAFADRPIRNWHDAAAADMQRYARFFHDMLERGVLLPTSCHDVVCVSLAHTMEDIQWAIEAAKGAVA
ncbi:MAG: aspartate aminotransferase family protein [Candidatus Xenobia bacterium]